MTDFWDFNAWGAFLVLTILLMSLLIANIIKKAIPFMKNALLPTSVLAGVMLLIFDAIWTGCTGGSFFDITVGGNFLFGVGGGNKTLETITYHTLALGFIASTLKSSSTRISKKRLGEVVDTGVTTVATYLIQGIFGILITILAAWLLVPELFDFAAAGILLPFGFGQGTGQALNYGTIFEGQGFEGGASFGLSVAALGFLSASVGGVIHLNIVRRREKLGKSTRTDSILHSEEIEDIDEVPMQESIDKMTLQLCLIATGYAITFGIIVGLSALLPSMADIIYGFNFLFGVLAASLIKVIMKGLKKIHVIKEKYTNNFLLTRVSNFFFDVMVVAGIAAIDLKVLGRYWHILLVLGVVGLVVTYIYNKFVAKKLFPDYREEQFLMMYGMLTGTASTGIILLREADPDFKTPAADNMVFQNFPAIILGFPMMFIAKMAPGNEILVLGIIIVYFAALNIVLFRRTIFKRLYAKRASKEKTE
ncbi:MAG: hypothetical protein IKL79_07170 [Clostridia bacterium]|nr:hypothetical protein [Clostridia bacterium]